MGFIPRWFIPRLPAPFTQTPEPVTQLSKRYLWVGGLQSCCYRGWGGASSRWESKLIWAATPCLHTHIGTEPPGVGPPPQPLVTPCFDAPPALPIHTASPRMCPPRFSPCTPPTLFFCKNSQPAPVINKIGDRKLIQPSDALFIPGTAGRMDLRQLIHAN